MRFTYFGVQSHSKEPTPGDWQTVPVGYQVRPRPFMVCPGFEDWQSAQSTMEALQASPDNQGWLYRVNEVILEITIVPGQTPRAQAHSVLERVAAAIEAAMQRKDLLRYPVHISNDTVYVGGRSVYTSEGLDLGLVRPMLDVEERLKAVIERAVAEHAEHEAQR